MSKLIISGIPRSGTTYLFRSINNLPQSPWSPHFDKIVDHAHYLNDTIKVHTPYNNFSLNEDIKVIFLHRNLFDCILSNVKTFNHDTDHSRNIGRDYNGVLEDKIFDQDILNLEQLFDVWVTNAVFPTLVIKYEHLAECQTQIEDFIERPFSLLPFNLAPGKELDPNIALKISNTYQNLLSKLSALPPIYYT